jgi:hypothetical protein
MSCVEEMLPIQDDQGIEVNHFTWFAWNGATEI